MKTALATGPPERRVMYARVSAALRAALSLRGRGRPDGSRVAVGLTREQARYLSVLAASDLRAHWPDGSVARDIHEPAWQALQPACAWGDEE